MTAPNDDSRVYGSHGHYVEVKGCWLVQGPQRTADLTNREQVRAILDSDEDITAVVILRSGSEFKSGAVFSRMTPSNDSPESSP